MLQKKGQQTIIGLILLVVMIFVLSALTPVIISFTNTAAGNLSEGGHGEAAVIVGLVPLFIWISLIVTIFIFTQRFVG